MSTKNKIIILTLIILVFVAGIAYFVIYPTLRDIQSISDSIKRERDDLELKYQRGQLLRQLVQDFDKVKDEKDKLNSIFIKSGKELEYVTLLENIATKYNLSQEIKISTKDIKSDASISTLPLIISLRGDYNQILKYLNEIEGLSFYFNINDIDAKLDRPQIGTIIMIISGNVYNKKITSDDAENNDI